MDKDVAEIDVDFVDEVDFYRQLILFVNIISYEVERLRINEKKGKMEFKKKNRLIGYPQSFKLCLITSKL